MTEPPDYENYDFSLQWKRRDLVNAAELELVRRLAGKPGVCLDMAGGYGRIAGVLENICGETHLIDFSSLNTDRARSSLKKTIVVQGNIFDLPYEDDSFDLVVLFRVMHHIENPQDLYREIMRVAKDGATVIVSVPNVRMTEFRGIDTIKLVAKGDNGHSIFAGPLECYMHEGFRLESIHGLGLFDNAVGKMMNSLKFLYRIDLYTSAIWFLKNNIILKFTVEKSGST
ncbi:MAG: class I SAM-dependent methyltransferase [Thermoplasmata archaeon]